MSYEIDYSLFEIAVLIPCYNEEATIVKVIEDFRKELPGACIYVLDNNSKDRSSEFALAAGAKVLKEKRQGKGYVLNSILNKIIADIYIMVDGDDTYPADKVHDLIKPIVDEDTDMVVGQRLSNHSKKAFRPLHYSGNKLVCSLINLVFSSKLKDPMSGYRAFNREVAMDLPVVATGFDVETEMTLQLLYRHFKISEIEIEYRERPKGSFSKLRTFSDGAKIIYKIFTILQSYKPLTFYGGIGLVLAFFAMYIGSFVIYEYVKFEYIYSVPKAILATGLILVAAISLAIGIILHSVNFRLLEISSNSQKMHRLIDNIHQKKESD